MWCALGPNLDEANAERTAGTLESLELMYQSIDKDCIKVKHHSQRSSPKEEEAVGTNCCRSTRSRSIQ